MPLGQGPTRPKKQPLHGSQSSQLHDKLTKDCSFIMWIREWTATKGCTCVLHLGLER